MAAVSTDVATKTTTSKPAGADAPSATGGNSNPRGELWRLFREPIPPLYAMIVIGVLVGFFYLVMEPWTVGGGETEIAGMIAYSILGSHLLQALPFWNGQVFYIDPQYWKVWISLGIFAGGCGGDCTAVLMSDLLACLRTRGPCGCRASRPRLHAPFQGARRRCLA